MATTLTVCRQCGTEFGAENSALNRARRRNAPLYCGRACSGLASRLVNPPTPEERREMKRLYDAARRIEKADQIRAKKAEYFKRTYDPVKAAQTRKENMHKHIAYCQRPEYRAWKSNYDKRYQAKKKFGEFAEAALLLMEIESEIEQRATRYEIYSTNDLLNKAQKRKRAIKWQSQS